jgi:thiol:disulfide interchange protein
MERTEPALLPGPESQSKLSPVLLWVLAAALVFRVVTAVLDKPAKDSGGGMVSWQPREKVGALAHASRKPILYDFTAAWCGPCHLLDADWKDPAVAREVNAAFVPARIVDRQREDGKNAPDVDELQRRFEVVGFPTLVAATPDGRLIGKMDGYRGREALLRFLKESRGN